MRISSAALCSLVLFLVALVGSTAASAAPSGNLEVESRCGVKNYVHRESQPGSPPASARVTLGTGRREYFLGENVLVEFRVTNDGSTPFGVELGGDYRGPRASRFVVTATDQLGRKVPDPNPVWGSNFGGLSRGGDVEPGSSYRENVPIMRYVDIREPGRYRIRICHDLGWNETPEAPSPSAELELDFAMPDLESAKRVVDRMERLPDCGGGLYRMNEEQCDFSAVRHPIYVPILIDRVRHGFTPAIDGLEMMDTRIKPVGDALLAFARDEMRETDPDRVAAASQFIGRLGTAADLAALTEARNEAKEQLDNAPEDHPNRQTYLRRVELLTRNLNALWQRVGPAP